MRASKIPTPLKPFATAIRTNKICANDTSQRLKNRRFCSVLWLLIVRYRRSIVPSSRSVVDLFFKAPVGSLWYVEWSKVIPGAMIMIDL